MTTATRRKYGVVCPSLTVDGHAIRAFGYHERPAMRAALGHVPGKHGYATAIRCAARPGFALAPEYAMDVCLTTACRDCPFQPDAPAMPAGSAPPSLPERRLAAVRTLAAAFRFDAGELAELAGIKTGMVAKALRGRGLPFVVDRLATVLGVAW